MARALSPAPGRAVGPIWLPEDRALSLSLLCIRASLILSLSPRSVPFPLPSCAGVVCCTDHAITYVCPNACSNVCVCVCTDICT